MRVLVTGGTGFLGRAVIKQLNLAGHEPITCTRTYDLRHWDEAFLLISNTEPDVIMHLACPKGGGGIGYAKAHPGSLMRDMLLINTNVLDAAKRVKVQQVIGAGSVCEYPADAIVPIHEAAWWKGYPEETNAPYGLAKKMMWVLGEALEKEYGRPRYTHLTLANLYGPGDKYEAGGTVGHVIPATVWKIVQAMRTGKSFIEVWGTGKPTRSFLHVDDAARAFLAAIGKPSCRVNVAASGEISIKNLVQQIACMMGWEGEIRFDTSKPDGQMRRRFTTDHVWAKLGWVPQVDFMDGLDEMVAELQERFERQIEREVEG